MCSSTHQYVPSSKRVSRAQFTSPCHAVKISKVLLEWHEKRTYFNLCSHSLDEMSTLSEEFVYFQELTIKRLRL